MTGSSLLALHAQTGPYPTRIFALSRPSLGRASPVAEANTDAELQSNGLGKADADATITISACRAHAGELPDVSHEQHLEHGHLDPPDPPAQRSVEGEHGHRQPPPGFRSATVWLPLCHVTNAHARTFITFTYASESDPGPYPFGPDIPIEQGSDQHAFMLNRSTCTLYELFNASWNGGHPTAGSGAIFNLTSNPLRPAGWTSADAAGLPMLPALVRLDEVRSGAIHHALRFTASRTDRSYLWPARHQAGAASDPTLPPMGARFRLRASFNISPYSPQAQVSARCNTTGCSLRTTGPTGTSRARRIQDGQTAC